MEPRQMRGRIIGGGRGEEGGGGGRKGKGEEKLARVFVS